MAATIADIDAKVVPRIKDTDAVLSQADRYEAIGSARAEYELTFPLEKVAQVNGAGVFDYGVSTNLPGFVDGRSTILRVYYPYVSTDQNPSLLEADRYGLMRLPSPTGLVLRFGDVTPSASEKFLVYWTAQHTVSVSACTVPASDDDAFADLGAHYACLMLAAKYAQSTDGTVQADSADRRSRVDLYKSLAKSYRESYEKKLGLGNDKPAVAGLAVADLDPAFSPRGGERLLFHERR